MLYLSGACRFVLNCRSCLMEYNGSRSCHCEPYAMTSNNAKYVIAGVMALHITAMQRTVLYRLRRDGPAKWDYIEFVADYLVRMWVMEWKEARTGWLMQSYPMLAVRREWVHLNQISMQLDDHGSIWDLFWTITFEKPRVDPIYIRSGASPCNTDKRVRFNARLGKFIGENFSGGGWPLKACFASREAYSLFAKHCARPLGSSGSNGDKDRALLWYHICGYSKSFKILWTKLVWDCDLNQKDKLGRRCCGGI